MNPRLGSSPPGTLRSRCHQRACPADQRVYALPPSAGVSRQWASFEGGVVGMAAGQHSSPLLVVAVMLARRMLVIHESYSDSHALREAAAGWSAGLG